jgi:RimJ/RimL family protein N-acetyltransferase
MISRSAQQLALPSEIHQEGSERPMNESITLRSATIQDADLLLEWRNDPKTREASHNTGEVERNEHVSWLLRTLKNPNRRLLVAEENGTPVGTVRADFSESVWELSWTVAPSARGRGVAKQMVVLLASQIFEPIRAEVKAGNIASLQIAEHAGMEFDRETDGVLHYTRPPLK